MRNAMRIALNHTLMIMTLVLSLFLMGADKGEQGGEERGALVVRQKTLRGRIATLQREQDFLLFQKAMYTADSKYLVLNVTEKTGQLKYKNRVLKDFPFVLSKDHPARNRTGVLALTEKREGKSDRHALLFGSDLIMLRKGAAAKPQRPDIPSLFLMKKDMESIFFAIETGARIYIVK